MASAALPLALSDHLALPSDLLGLIFSYISFRSRILVIARVCRRWRSAALLSVTHIPHRYVTSAPISLVPSLNSCGFEASVPTWSADQLAKIRVVNFVGTPSQSISNAPFSRLVGLRATVADDAAVAAIAEQMGRNVDTLTMLDVVDTRDFPSALHQLKALPSLPALRWLGRRLTREFLSRIVTQCDLAHLTHLDINAFEAPLPRSIPSLRTLRIRLLHLHDSTIDWIAALPSLVSLHVEGQRGVAPPLYTKFVARCAHLLTYLPYCVYEPTQDLREPLRRCTQLRGISISRAWQPHTAMLRHVATQIRHLELTVGLQPPRDIVQHFTALTGLYVLSEQVPEGWRLPALRKLRTDRVDLRWILDALRTFPTLEKLKIRVLRSADGVTAAELELTLRAAEQRGLLTLNLGLPAAPLHAIDVPSLQRKLHWLRIVTEPPRT